MGTWATSASSCGLVTSSSVARLLSSGGRGRGGYRGLSLELWGLNEAGAGLLSGCLCGWHPHVHGSSLAAVVLLRVALCARVTVGDAGRAGGHILSRLTERQCKALTHPVL